MGFELTETLYEPLEKDGTTVKEGDPRARFLVGVAGQTLPDDEAERLGLRARPKAEPAPDGPTVPTVPTVPTAKVKPAAEAKVVSGPDVSPKERR